LASIMAFMIKPVILNISFNVKLVVSAPKVPPNTIMKGLTRNSAAGFPPSTRNAAKIIPAPKTIPMIVAKSITKVLLTCNRVCPYANAACILLLQSIDIIYDDNIFSQKKTLSICFIVIINQQNYCMN